MLRILKQIKAGEYNPCFEMMSRDYGIDPATIRNIIKDFMELRLIEKEN